jgi:hypothetical protein
MGLKRLRNPHFGTRGSAAFATGQHLTGDPHALSRALDEIRGDR